MSQLDSAVSKTLQGAEWRGTVTVPMGGESMELTVRQLVDDEFYEVSDKINWDELEEYSEAVPSDLREEYEEIGAEDDEDLTDEELEKREELEEQINEQTPRIFDVLSYETFQGLQLAAKYGVEPDEEDKKSALKTKGSEIEAEYGVQVRTPEDTEVYWHDQIEEMIDNSTNMSTFLIGMQVLTTTAGEEGN